MFVFFLFLFVQVAYIQSAQQQSMTKKNRLKDSLSSQQRIMTKNIEDALKKLVPQKKIPGMIAAICSSKGVMAIAANGIRKTGSPVKLTVNDTVHIGSCTKAMTAFMLAKFVQNNSVSWQTTLIQALPQLNGKIHGSYHQISLWQLLTHRAGLPANPNDWWVHNNLKIKNRRLAILKDNLKDPSSLRRGQYLYSNFGYMIAGCMIEGKTGLTWEQLMQKCLFTPLNMVSAGFGPPGPAGKVEQPWGHVKSGSRWVSQYFDNAQALGPAVRIHCNLKDWAKFAALQLPGHRKILNQDLLEKLVTPVGQYAGGWLVASRPWAKGIVYTHSGSNTMWYATIWVAPKINRIFIVATNSCDVNSHSLCDIMIARLIEINLKKNLINSRSQQIPKKYKYK